MKTIQIPARHTALLDIHQTEKAIQMVKEQFARALADGLDLQKVSAPMFVPRGTGIQDDLNGTEAPVHFAVPALDGQVLEVVHSLAKWKRLKLAEAGYGPGKGLYTDMRALRPSETLTPLHSIYVDQWDWEKVIAPEARTLTTLKATVRAIYSAILKAERSLAMYFPMLRPRLPEEITFLHAEELQKAYPELTPRERETMAAREFGAIFVIGIGAVLADGRKHDGRAPDYDDWSSPTKAGFHGLNGDIVLWHPELECAFEISSMGIRVDPAALQRQLRLTGHEDRQHLMWHQKLLQGELPQTIGGGIGQSRLCMFLLRKVHIGEVQASVWPEALRAAYRARGIALL